MLKIVLTLACTVFVGAAIAARAQENSGLPQGVQESLIAWAASDFAAQGQQPEKVRNVHVRYSNKDSGERIYLLCGEFLPGNSANASWTHFATIKTAPYEQWIGGMAEAHCGHALPLSAAADDLSPALQARLRGEAGSTAPP